MLQHWTRPWLTYPLADGSSTSLSDLTLDLRTTYATVWSNLAAQLSALTAQPPFPNLADVTVDCDLGAMTKERQQEWQGTKPIRAAEHAEEVLLEMLDRTALRRVHVVLRWTSAQSDGLQAPPFPRLARKGCLTVRWVTGGLSSAPSI